MMYPMPSCCNLHVPLSPYALYGVTFSNRFLSFSHTGRGLRLAGGPYSADLVRDHPSNVVRRCGGAKAMIVTKW